MVRKGQMVINDSLVLASFIEGKQLPFSTMKSDVSLRIAPHQLSLNTERKGAKRLMKLDCREVDVSCICVENVPRESSFDAIISRTAKERTSLIWLNPTSIPTECLASIFAKWLHNTRPTENLGLGIVIPLSENTEIGKDSSVAWSSTSSGPLEKELEKIERPVWYPSLAREPEYLGQIADTIKPFDIFPIVEFPQVINYAVEKRIATHCRMLDMYRTRTRNFIYLNNNSPGEAIRTLYESFCAIPRSGKMPRSVVITPGGKPVSYLVTLLAGVLAGGIFVTSERETPYSEAHKIWGTAIFKKCE